MGFRPGFWCFGRSTPVPTREIDPGMEPCSGATSDGVAGPAEGHQESAFLARHLALLLASARGKPARVVGRRMRPDADSISLRLPPAARFVYLVDFDPASGLASPETAGGFSGWLSFDQLVELSGGDAAHASRLAADFAASGVVADAPWLVDCICALKYADRVSVAADGALRVATERMFLVRWADASCGGAGGSGSWEFEADLRLLDAASFGRAARAFFAQWRPHASAVLDVRRSFLGCTSGATSAGPTAVRPMLAARVRPAGGGSSAAPKAPPSVGALAAAAVASLIKALPVSGPPPAAGLPPPHQYRAPGQVTPAAPVARARINAPPNLETGVYANLRNSADPDDVLKWAFEVVRKMRGMSLLQVGTGLVHGECLVVRPHVVSSASCARPGLAGGPHDAVDAVGVAEPVQSEQEDAGSSPRAVLHFIFKKNLF